MPIKAGDWRRSPISIATGRWVWFSKKTSVGVLRCLSPPDPRCRQPIRRAMAAVSGEMQIRGCRIDE